MQKHYYWQNTDWLNFVPERFISFFDLARGIEARERKIAEDLEIDNLHLLVANAIQHEIEGSNQIEGIRMDSYRIRSAIAESMGLINDAWSPARQDTGKEARAVKASVNFLKNGDKLSIQDILSTHAMLQNDSAWGKFRDHPEFVYDENGNSVFEAPDAKYVIPLMHKFIRWWSGERLLFPKPVAAALSHFTFVTIHPFLDGNGRMARMIAEKALVKQNETFRFYSVSFEINYSKNKYYELLNNAQIKDQIEPFLQYMLEIQMAALDVAEIRAKKIIKAREFIEKFSLSFTHTEKAMIFEMAASDRAIWSFFSATQYFEDGDAAEQAWAHLNQLGIINNGLLNIPE